MKMRIGVIWNLRAGPSSGDLSMQVRSLLGQGAYEPEFLTAASGPELVAAGSLCLSKGCNVLVAAGGDGTVSSLASLLVGTGAALGVLPVGTLNHFARDLSIPMDMEGACQVILDGHSRNVDVGELNGRFFVNNSSLGLYPSIVKRREWWERTGYNRILAFTAAIFYVLRRYPFLDVVVRADRNSFSLRSPFVFVGNNDYEIEGVSVGRRARVDGGNLSLYTAQRTGRLGLLRIAFAALTRRLRRSQDFEILAAREIVIDSPRTRVSVALDGEVMHMSPPLRYCIRPQALRVLAPE